MKKTLLVTGYWLVLGVLPALGSCPSADLTGDCRVDLADLVVLASQWLTDDDVESNGIVWVYIDDPGVSGHEPFHGYMSKYETTNSQYCEYLNSAVADGLITVYDHVVYAASDTDHAEPYFYTYAADSASQITYSNGTFSVRTRDNEYMGDHPVVVVSWYGATAFCTYYSWRLPTEWDWQAVADYDGSYTYGCGNTINQSKANYYNYGFANPRDLSAYPYTLPAGHSFAYGYGLCDMAGNVWEWTSSCYYSDCAQGYRIQRGGGWGDGNVDCKVTFRSVNDPFYTSYDVGFRVCR